MASISVKDQMYLRWSNEMTWSNFKAYYLITNDRATFRQICTKQTSSVWESQGVRHLDSVVPFWQNFVKVLEREEERDGKYMSNELCSGEEEAYKQDIVVLSRQDVFP